MLSIIAPDKYAEILEGFVNRYKDCGWLPKWLSPAETGMMPGTLIDAVIAHGAVTNVSNKNVLNMAFEGMVKHANTAPCEKRYGRKGIKDYLTQGYVPRNLYSESVNATLDYAYCDFCIAQTAKAIGKDDEIFQEYMQRSKSYKNIFDKETGFMRGKDTKGQMASDFSPYRWGDEYCEGSAWQNSFGVYHDINGLANLHGGKNKLISKLDKLFDAPRTFYTGGYKGEIHEMSEMAGANFGQCAISNQPSFHIPYLYAALGDRSKTQHWVRRLVNEAFSWHDDGFPGDEDNGSASAWYIFSVLGFYPLCPGKPKYIKGIKMVDKIVINGKEINPDTVEGEYVFHTDLI